MLRLRVDGAGNDHFRWGSVSRQLQIAGVTLSIESVNGRWAFDSESRYGPFEVSGQDADVELTVHWHPAAVQELGEALFSARDMPHRYPPNWRLYRDGHGRYVLEVNSAGGQPIRHRVGIFSEDFRQGDIYVDLDPEIHSAYPYPLATPLDRVLFVNILAHGVGIMLHACGVVLDGKGYVFAGPSDSGKTTLSRLWAEFGSATILGDECLIVREHEGQLWVYGTPWVGEAGHYSPDGVPLEGLHFIHHAYENRLMPVPFAAAAEQLLAQSTLTPYDAATVEFGLDSCLKMASEIPAQSFGFVPDESAVRFIEGHLGRG
jgi:hypothetical protein